MNGERALIVVNYSPHDSQCFLQLPFSDLADKKVLFSDVLSEAVYERDGQDLLSRGLFLDLPAWGYHVFEVSESTNNSLAEEPTAKREIV